MVNRTKFGFLGLFCTFLMVSCSNNLDINTNIENPATYSFARDGVSTVSFSGQSTRIGMATELIEGMLDINSTESLLLEMYTNETATGGDAVPFSNPEYNASTKSVKSKVAASQDFFSSNTAESAIIKAEIQSWVTDQVTEVFPNENVLAEVGVAGQIADGTSVRYVNAQGLEYNQAVAKSLIGALMIDQICNNYLSPAILDAGNNVTDNDSGVVDGNNSYTTMEHKWDEAYGYLFGAATDTSNPLTTLGEDAFLNKYLSRVENDSDFTGIAAEVFDAYKLGRAAIVAGYYDVRDQQAEIIREKLSEVIAIRAVYYLQQGKLALSNSDFGGAFHDLSEGFGFIYSLRFTRKSNSTEPYFTKEEVDGFMTTLTEGNGFWDINAETLDEISETIASKFSFTVAQAAE